jgi:hypothetical protein
VTRSAELAAPPALAILFFFGTTVNPGTSIPFLIGLAALAIGGAVLFILHSIKKESTK